MDFNRLYDVEFLRDYISTNSKLHITANKAEKLVDKIYAENKSVNILSCQEVLNHLLAIEKK